MKLISKHSWVALLAALFAACPATSLRAADPADRVADRVERALEKVEAALDQVEDKAEAAGDAVANVKADAEDAPDFDWGDRPENNRKEVIRTGQSATVKKGEVVPEVVVTQGSATIDGDVTGDVVVVLGTARINGRVWGNVVNVGKGLVLGPNARIRGDAVGVIGGIHMGTNSVIGGTGVGILGGITKKEGARILGDEVPIAFDPWMGPDGPAWPDWISNSFYELVLKARPLSLNVGWVWVVWAIFLGVYLLLGLLFPSACELTANTLKGRALTSALVGLLLIPLIPLVITLVAATGIGLVAVPFLLAAVFLAGLVGKAALLLHLGNAVGRAFKTQFPPLMAMLVGAVPLTALYLIPFLGLVVFKLTDIWALGAATMALFVGFRKERPPAAPAPNLAPFVPATAQPAASNPPMQALGITTVSVVPALAAAAVAAPVTFGFSPLGEPVADSAGTIPNEPVRPAEPMPRREPVYEPVTPTLPEALTLPRVGFKDRFLATCIDWLILSMVCGPLGLMGYFMLLFPMYFAAMWVWKQTTIGGTVLRLKVVRLDGRRIDWPTAGVRAVGALFGSMAAGLGYFWSGWDAEKQGWHDKIAGTVVVKGDKVQPLV